MAYTKHSEEKYTYFTKEEDKLITKWLKEHGYSWQHNTVCGGCCGMYEDEYYVPGIGGVFRKSDKEEFIKFAEENGIGCSVDGYTIKAEDR